MFFNLLAEGATGTETPATTEPAPADPWYYDFIKPDTILGHITVVAVKVVVALLLMLILFAIINSVTKRIYHRLQKRNADETLARVGTQSARIVLKILVLVCLVGFVGITTASISALIAALGVGISMAVQGTLSNFAGGAIIIIMRPFKIGDYIVSNGQEGTVEDIKLFYTTIVTVDNRVISIPNGTLANNVIVNVTAKDTRRVDLTVQVAYGSDVDKVKSIITDVCAKNELVFKDPAPFVELSVMNESSLDFTVRSWCNKPDYWTVNFALLDAIKKALDENGIQVPYKQIDVHVDNIGK